MRLEGLGATTPVDTIAQAIQTQEGYFPGSLAYTNNNPGNLQFAGQAGATAGANGFAVFPSYQAGYDALVNQINLYASRGLTVQQMMDIYAPAAQTGNDPTAYANTVASAVGATPDTPLSDILGGTSSDSTGVPDDVMANNLALGFAVAAGLALWFIFGR